MIEETYEWKGVTMDRVPWPSLCYSLWEQAKRISGRSLDGDPIRFEGRIMHRERLEVCPICGQKRVPGAHNATMVQLGFEKDPEVVPTGVAGVSRFIWAQDPEEVGTVCGLERDMLIILSSYNEPLTGAEFLHILELCPIQSTEFLGRDFC